MEKINTTTTIKEFKNRSRTRKTTEHSAEFVAKRDARLREKLIAQLKAEDPRYFISNNNPDKLEVIRIPRLNNEVYELIPGTTRYYVSNMGNALKLVYDKFTNVYLEHPLNLIGSKNKTGKTYYDIYIQNEDGEGMRVRLSRAIVKTFIDKSFPLSFDPGNGLIAEHINNNSENNKLSNLRIANQSDNIKFAIFEQGKSVGCTSKKCYAYNVNTKEVREYPSTGELCRDIWNSSNKGYFHTALKNNATTKHGWKVGYDLNELRGKNEK